MTSLSEREDRASHARNTTKTCDCDRGSRKAVHLEYRLKFAGLAPFIEVREICYPTTDKLLEH